MFTQILEKIAGRPVRLFDKIVTVVFLLIIFFVFYIVLDANKYSAQVIVIEGEGKVGVNPTDESLDFGDMSPGTTAVRRVSIENGTPIGVYVAVIRLGSINDLMKLNENFFTLKGGESIKLEFATYMPASAPIGEKMSGKVYIFKIPLLWQWSSGSVAIDNG